MNDVQNKRLPSLEEQIQSHEQCRAQTQENAKQLSNLQKRLDATASKPQDSKQFSDLKQRLSAVESKQTRLESLLSNVDAIEDAAYAADANDAAIKSLTKKVERLEADLVATRSEVQDLSNSVKKSGADESSEASSLTTVLENFQKLSETVKKLQEEKNADSMTIKSLTESVTKLQSDKAADADRLQRLESQQDTKADATILQSVSERIERLQSDRASESNRIETTADNVKALKVQQADKASKVNLNILSQKVDEVQAKDNERSSAMEVARKNNRKLEERIDGVEKQFNKRLDDQSRKKPENVQADTSGVHTLAQRLQSRIEKLETQSTNAAKASSVNSSTVNSLFKRIDKLEQVSPSKTMPPQPLTVNDYAHALLKGVNRGDSFDDETKALLKDFASNISTPKMPKPFSQGSVKQSSEKSTPSGGVKGVLSGRELTKRMNGPSPEQEGGAQMPKKPALKRTADQAHGERDSRLSDHARKRAKSTPGGDAPSVVRSSPSQSQSLGPGRGRHNRATAASSPSENESEEEDEEDEEDVAPRRTSRSVKPTERGSHLAFLDPAARRSS